MKSIKSQFETFQAKAVQHGTGPTSKEGAMELGFYAGFVAAMKTGNDLAHEASDLESERRYEAVRREMAEFFDPEHIMSYYPKPKKGKRAESN